MRAPLGSRGALLGDLGVSLGAALGGRQRRSRIDMRGRGRWPSAGATLDLDFVNQQGYAYGQGLGRIRDLVTISGGAGGTVVGPSGLIVSASAPRFDYDPLTLACKGLLIEEQRTNLAKNSNNGLGWVAAGTTPPTLTLGASYLGEVCAKIDFTPAMTGTGYAGCRATRDAAGYDFPISAGTTYAYAAYVALSRPLTGGEVLGLYVTGVAGTAAVLLNAANSAPFVGVFTRITKDSQLLAGTGTDYFTVYKNSALGSDVSLYITKLQFEAGAFATSYIPTGAAAVTRTADAAIVSGAAFASFFNAVEGTFAVEGVPAGFAQTSWNFLLSANGGAQANSIPIGTYQPSGAYTARVWSGGTNVSMDSGAIAAVNAAVKAAVGYKVNDSAFSVNGASPTLGGAGAVPVGVDRLMLGDHPGGTWKWNGYIKRLRYWPRRLSNGELQELTR